MMVHRENLRSETHFKAEGIFLRACRGNRLSARPESRLVRLEVQLPKQLINEAVPFAFEKCLADVAVQGWADNIQSDILTVSNALHPFATAG